MATKKWYVVRVDLCINATNEDDADKQVESLLNHLTSTGRLITFDMVEEAVVADSQPGASR